MFRDAYLGPQYQSEVPEKWNKDVQLAKTFIGEVISGGCPVILDSPELEINVYPGHSTFYMGAVL